MKVNLSIDYHTTWGQTLYVCGSISALGNGNEIHARAMEYISPSTWSIELEVADDTASIEYYYLVKENDTTIIRKEYGNPHTLLLDTKRNYIIKDLWQAVPQQKFPYTSAFSNSFFARKYNTETTSYKREILLQVNCLYIGADQEVILLGSSKTLGAWQPKDALSLVAISYDKWQISIDASRLDDTQEYKFAIYDKKAKEIIGWEEGDNRILKLSEANIKADTLYKETLEYRCSSIDWKAAGVAIPVFSLRSEDSFGIGEFPDLKKMVDWCVITGQKVIQVLPVNDTTITHKWIDSYPYNAISTYALHPLYIGLKEYPLSKKDAYKRYLKEASRLNSLDVVDYEQVSHCKWIYLNQLYQEIGDTVLNETDFLSFYDQNEEWLLPYACFSYLRDKHQTSDYTTWSQFSVFNKEELDAFVNADKEIKHEVYFFCFIQYLLHKQLTEVKEYANQHGVILKGDIPIGINRHSVEAWVEPHLFNLDTQTGAPPDDFSVNGQNWGFPTYNWSEMAKDGYQWWIKRFRKMADYFDAYRIDHILGFFRIWEIPKSSVQGLLGYFNPALPLSVEDIAAWGMQFDERSMTTPYIRAHFLHDLFGEYTQEVIRKYLHQVNIDEFELNEKYNTQQKIKALFVKKEDDKSLKIQNGLYSLCNEVLFVRDKYHPYKYHPRITAQHTYAFRNLDEYTQSRFNDMYNDFFYNRHTQFWREEAMKKLPVLINSTQMLVCGEDLGMIPECVPSVMQELQILSLEIERMPKSDYTLFTDLATLPYLSVCTTSTHDMSPIRAWWEENKDVTQLYYNNILKQEGDAPCECTPAICRQILTNHLNSPSMLTIIPLQDWLSFDKKIRRENPEEERINIPSIPYHYWQYRMHLSLEELIKAEKQNKEVRKMIEESGRG